MVPLLRRSLTARTAAIGGVFAVLLVASFAVLLFAIAQLRDAGAAALRAQEAVTVGTELETSVVNLENGLRGYVASGRAALLEPFERARQQYPDDVRRLQALAEDDPGLRAEVDALAEQISDYVDLWALPLLGVARDDLEVARSVIVNATGRQRVEDIRNGFRQMYASARAEAARRERRANARASVVQAMGVGGIFLATVLTAGMALLLRRHVLRPVQGVARASETVASGDLTARVPDDRSDELGDLARAFNQMATSLERSQAELARRAAELQRSNRELEDYASVTSHDLQGPLVTIGMYSEMLARRLDDDPQARELAEHIRDGAAGMRRLVRELLAYAQLDRRPAHREPVPLAEPVREAIENLAGPIHDAQAEIILDEPMPVVAGDRARLAQLVQNLLTNAIKFTRDGHPVVHVAARLEGDMVQVTVRDNGIGLSPAQTEVIFRPFHRLHSADRYEGTGIGLAVCQKIVDQHGGRIWAEGRPGQGASFHFTLPLDQPGPPATTLPGAGGLPTWPEAALPHPGTAPSSAAAASPGGQECQVAQARHDRAWDSRS